MSCLICISLKLIPPEFFFANDGTFPEVLVPTNACNLDDYISAHEGSLR